MDHINGKKRMWLSIDKIVSSIILMKFFLSLFTLLMALLIVYADTFWQVLLICDECKFNKQA